MTTTEFLKPKEAARVTGAEQSELAVDFGQFAPAIHSRYVCPEPVLACLRPGIQGLLRGVGTLLEGGHQTVQRILRQRHLRGRTAVAVIRRRVRCGLFGVVAPVESRTGDGIQCGGLAGNGTDHGFLPDPCR